MGTTPGKPLYWMQHAPIFRREGTEIIGSGIDRDLDGAGVLKAHSLGKGILKLVEAGKIPRLSENIVTSPLLRAVSSAEIIASYLSVEVEVDERLRAQNFGRFEGLTSREARAEPSLQGHLHENLTEATLYDDQAPDGGESIRQATTRLLEARGSYLRRGMSPLIITHGSMLNVVIGNARGLSILERRDINRHFKGSVLVDQEGRSDIGAIPIGVHE